MKGQYDWTVNQRNFYPVDQTSEEKLLEVYPVSE